MLWKNWRDYSLKIAYSFVSSIKLHMEDLITLFFVLKNFNKRYLCNYLSSEMNFKLLWLFQMMKKKYFELIVSTIFTFYFHELYVRLTVFDLKQIFRVFVHLFSLEFIFFRLWSHLYYKFIFVFIIGMFENYLWVQKVILMVVIYIIKILNFIRLILLRQLTL